jgi:hypothetical protein
MATFTDDFNRAGPGMGGNWADNIGTVIIDADNTRSRSGSDGVDCLARVTAISPGTSQDAEATLSNVTEDVFGPAVYVDTAGGSKAYALTGSSDTIDLLVIDGGYTSLQTYGPAANGDVLKLRVSRSGNNNTLQPFKNGASLGADYVHVSTSLVGGAVGVLGYAGSADSNSTSATQFVGGDSNEPPSTQMTGGLRSGRRG